MADSWQDFGKDHPIKPADVGLDPSKLDRLRLMMQKWVGEKDLPMAMALVARKGKVVWWQGCGEERPGKTRHHTTMVTLEHPCNTLVILSQARHCSQTRSSASSP
jgi:hypothetical protein